MPRVLPGLVRCSSPTPAVAAAGLLVAGDEFGQTKVENLGVAALGDKDVCRLDVAVNDALRVCGIQSIGDVAGQRQQRFGVDGAALDAMLQGLAVEELHGDEGLAVGLTDIVNGADIGVIERGGGLGLALKPGQSLRVFGDFIGQELQRHKTPQAGILGFVHHAHAAAAQLFEDSIMRDGLADHRVAPLPMGADVSRQSRTSQSRGAWRRRLWLPCCP